MGLQKFFSTKLLYIGYTPNFDTQNLRKKVRLIFRNLRYLSDWRYFMEMKRCLLRRKPTSLVRSFWFRVAFSASWWLQQISVSTWPWWHCYILKEIPFIFMFHGSNQRPLRLCTDNTKRKPDEKDQENRLTFLPGNVTQCPAWLGRTQARWTSAQNWWTYPFQWKSQGQNTLIRYLVAFAGCLSPK